MDINKKQYNNKNTGLFHKPKQGSVLKRARIMSAIFKNV
jgi:hypothetical protein